MESYSDSLSAALARVDELRAEIDAMRPLPPDVLGRAMQRLQLEWTYHSNAIEGNSLDYGETRALLLHGVTAHGKPLKDHLDIRRHREVLEFLEGFVKSDEPLTLAVVREMHKLLMGDTYEVEAETTDGRRIKREGKGGEFKTYPNHVRTATGETHYYATPEETPARMTDLMDRYTAQLEHVAAGELHPIELAAALHHGFVEIHPFPDGNGRLARALMNLLLMRAGYPPAVIRQEHRPAYYGALAEADAGDLAAFVGFVADEMLATMELYLRALRNGPDPDAFDRHLALLKRELDTIPREIIPRSKEMLSSIAIKFVKPLILGLEESVSKLNVFFEEDYQVMDLRNRRGGTLDDDNYDKSLEDGNWIQLDRWWNLQRFKLNTSFNLQININIKFDEDAMVLETHHGIGDKMIHRYLYNNLPDGGEAARVAARMQAGISEALDFARARALGQA